MEKIISRFRGVSWDKKLERWVAKMAVDHRRYYLGVYDDEEKAGAAIATAIQEYANGLPITENYNGVTGPRHNSDAHAVFMVYMRRSEERQGVPPTVSDVAYEMGKSPMTVNKMVLSLVASGLLEPVLYTDSKRVACFRVVGGKWTPPPGKE